MLSTTAPRRRLAARRSALTLAGLGAALLTAGSLALAPAAWAETAPPAGDPLAAKAPEGMVYVPAGDFTMGTNQGEGIGPNTPRTHNDARPEHQVTVAAFYLDKT